MQKATKDLLESLSKSEYTELAKALVLATSFRDIITKHKIAIEELVEKGIAPKTVHKLLLGTHRFDLAMISKIEVVVNELVRDRIKLIDIPKGD